MSNNLTITCPYCGGKIRADQAIAEGEYRDLVLLLARFGDGAPTVRAYIDLFASEPGATMRVATQLRIARELAKLWEDQSFHIDGKTWPITRPQIITAMHEVVQTKGQACGFRGHNYLKRVMLTPARQNDVAVERRIESERRAGANRPPDTEPAEKEPEQMTDDELKEFYVDMCSGGGVGPTLGVTKTAGRLLRKRGIDTEVLLKEAGLERGNADA